MAEVRCPMCSKSNPDHLETCQFCQARLKPLTAPLGDPIRPGEEPIKKSTSELESVLPEWLRKVRNPDEEHPESSDVPKADIPLADSSQPLSQPVSPLESNDFLSGLASQSSEDEAVPDWLANFRAESGQAPIPTEQPAEEAPDEASWLANLRTESPAESSQEDSIKESEQIGGELPGWLSGGEGEPHKDEAGLPWLAGVDVPSSEFESGPDSKMAGTSLGDSSMQDNALAGETQPDWLEKLAAEPTSAIPAGETPALVPQSDLPDWMSGLRSAESPAHAGSSETPSAQSDLPDWLMGLGATEPGASAESPAHLPAQADLPDELNESELVEASASGDAPAQLSAPSDLSDWLSGLGTTEPAAPAKLPSEIQPESNLPDWLSAATDEKTVSPEPSSDVDLPDWLGGAATVVAAAGVDEPAKTLPGPDTQGQEVPDWLASLPAAESNVPSTQPFSENSLAPASGVPAFLEEQPDGASSDMEAAFSMEMPDWLSAVKPSESGSVPAESLPDENITPGSLPSWVQAMRPVESIVAETPEGTAADSASEAEGPLAGLRGVLPAGPGIQPISKPQAYGIKLQADDDQVSNATLLEKMLGTEAEPRPLHGSSLVLSARVLRWAIFILLLLAVGLPIFVKTTFTPNPGSFLNELDGAVQAVNVLPAGAPVLLVFDYDPALSGELESAGLPVVDHLMLKGAKLGLLSTSPTGPALADRFIARTLGFTGHTYQVGDQYVNLGYLPGGSAGILGFAHNPLEIIPALQTPVLSGISKLDDFEAVVLLTGNFETGQAWIEQAGPVMNGKPLIIIASAQAEPVLIPYVVSGQVRGLVAGLSGGQAYESMNNRPGLNRRYWDAFSLGMFVTEIMIAVGGLWSLVVFWRSRRQEELDRG